MPLSCALDEDGEEEEEEEDDEAKCVWIERQDQYAAQQDGYLALII